MSLKSVSLTVETMRLLNESFRFILLKLFVPFYEALLSRFSGCRIALEVRNSALSSGDYNAFLSDLDLAATGVADFAQAASLRKLHGVAQRLFPFLGELELYTAGEWAERRAIEAEFGARHGRTRVHRKLRWMQSFLEKSRNPLARLRARRGLEKCAASIGPSPEKHLALFLTEIAEECGLRAEGLPDYFRYRHPWMEDWIATPYAAKPGDLTLAPTEAALLGAIFPPVHYDPGVDGFIGELRQNPGIRSYLRLFSRFEYLTMHACVWGSREMPDWWWANEPDLSHWMR